MKTHQASGPDLWNLVRGAPWIDPHDLLAAVDAECRSMPIDYRTRLLVHESLMALKSRFGFDEISAQLSHESRSTAIEILNDNPGEVRFPTLEKRMRDRTDAAAILSFFRELGAETREDARLVVGGSTALILAELLRRGTDDVDVVNEVPAVLRNQHELLSRLAARYGLALTHFQSHYLPGGFENRLRYLDRFRQLDVYLVDPLDIFVGKLFSRRDKDLDDLRMLVANFPKQDALSRLQSSAGQLIGNPEFKQNAERNWYILFGQELGIV